jgi:hypothetical protein
MKKLIFFLSLIPAFAFFNESESFFPNIFGMIWIAGLYLFYTFSKPGKEIIKDVK